MEYENCSRTWTKLKKALKEEFEKTVDSLQVHRELVKRKKKSDETLQTYAYKMLQIASQVNLEVSVVIKYIIEGIPDEAVNKSILYGAQTIKELKKRFSQYESMKQEAAKTKTKAMERSDKPGRADDRNKKKNSEVKSTAAAVKRCYNCGSEKHVISACPDSQKGKKCFKCNGFGHIAAECPDNNKPKDVYVISRPKKEKYQKIVSINDYKTLALVDTGSDLTLICKSEYERLGAPTLRETQVCFEGLASGMNATMGEFTTSMTVENDVYIVTYHVVPDAILKHPILLGTDFLDQVELRVRHGDVKFLKIDKDDHVNFDESGESYIHQINVIDKADEVDLSHITEKYYREEILKIITNYKPDKTEDIGIKAKIILRSDEPIVSRPRRLSPS